MPKPRTREEKLFGAACLKVTLDAQGARTDTSEIYRGALSDLGLTDGEVDEYLRVHRAEVELKLARSRRS